METRPKLLDWFCGEGGAAMGYYKAGFDVFGVDIESQPRYPFPFMQANVLTLEPDFLSRFEAHHASPVCKRYSACSTINNRDHPDQIADVREMLINTGKPWAIENVEGAPLKDPVWLCGTMFGLRTYRHRGFETSFDLSTPDHPAHTTPLRKMGRPVQDDEFIHVVGHYSGVQLARDVMGMPWGSRDGMAQAVPVAYTEYVGKFLMEAVRQAHGN
jgi:DNA (cytosine-5)-methyltransferase 1